MSKFRRGFVTNSSSSSFICEITGDVETGYDMCIEDAGMYQCENGHTFREDYILGELSFSRDEMVDILKGKIKNKQGYIDRNKDNASGNSWVARQVKSSEAQIAEMEKDIEKLVNTADEEVKSFISELIGDYELNDRYSVPAVLCPICQMKYISDKKVLDFMLKKFGVERKIIEDEMRKEAGK